MGRGARDVELTAPPNEICRGLRPQKTWRKILQSGITTCPVSVVKSQKDPEWIGNSRRANKLGALAGESLAIIRRARETGECWGCGAP